MLVYVLLFNARTENEGIHTLKVEDRNIVLMFEDEDDATRFGLMLEAQDFPPATVESFEFDEIQEFCQEAGYECKQVPQGALATPPESNVDQTDWDPDNPPDDAPNLSSGPASPSDDEANLPQSELDRIRQQLEKLL
ncbi:MAG: DUF3110 domain-containing protein [Cyanobacteria bacterium Co-bin8]|nr:DUF3110 domain-containing protein [Cyanobacteria bacterium Co-bin8]